MCKRLVYFICIALMLSAGSLWADQIWENQIADENDDVEQQPTRMYMNSSDLELVDDSNTHVGVRFPGAPIPKGSAISRAYIEFQVDETEADQPANLIIYGDLTPGGPAFDSGDITNVSRRPGTTARVAWSPEHWPTVGEKKQTPDISPIIEEIVSAPGWFPGNAIVLIVIDDANNPATGFRTVEAGPGDDAAKLHVEYGPAVKASGSVPADTAVEVSRDAILSWNAGVYANSHNVYFGTEADNLAEVSTGQTDATFDPGRLEFGQTYFWRVDEVNGAPDRTVYEGNVWSFTVEQFSYPITNIQVTATSENADMGPEKTIDGSGLNEMDQHGTIATDMWLSGMGDPAPSIQYEFDKAYKLHELWIWNSNQMVESFVGLGAKDVVIEYSVNGTDWTVLEGVTQLAQATGTDDYVANNIIDFAGAQAKYVRITISGGFGFLPQYGLSEVRFYFIPTFAREPMPADGSVVNSATVELSWRGGREAASSEVYLGTDPNALALAGTTDNSSYTASGLDFSTTYYWSVTEINEAEAITAFAGDMWSFTTPDYEIVEDFEGYNDACNRVFFSWQDGIGHKGGTDIDDCDVPPYSGNGGGSIVGNDVAPFTEKTIVNPGGSTQSMPFSYDNFYGPSEATLDLPGQDWTTSGIQTLAIAFRGTSDNTGTLYAKINNTKVVNDGATSSLALEGWQIWNVDLGTVSGLQNVTSLTIGVDGGNAAGMLYIDDIRLLAGVAGPINEWRIQASTDDVEEHDRDFGTMESITSSDLEMPYEQNVGTDAAHQMVGCRWPGIPIPQGATITEAWVQFSADNVDGAERGGPVSLIIQGQLEPDGETFTETAMDVSLRPKTTASVVWDVPVWDTVHAQSEAERTPDISPIIQEIVNQPDWAGAAIVLIFSDNPDNPSQGYREPESADGGGATDAPLLHIVYE